jgi:hypothetical protein
MGSGRDAESSAGPLNQGVPRTVAHSRCGVETSIEAEGEAGADRHAQPLPDVDLAIPDGEPGRQREVCLGAEAEMLRVERRGPAACE